MRIGSSLLHVCAGLFLILAMLVLLNSLNGQTQHPMCDGTVPGDEEECPDADGGVSCPDVDETTCVKKTTTCGIVQSVPWRCPKGNNEYTLCEYTTAPCVINYYCYWSLLEQDFYYCLCDSSGTVYSIAETEHAGMKVDCNVGGG